MTHAKSREVVLSIHVTAELQTNIETLRRAWKNDPASVPRGITCAETKDGQFSLMAAESVFITLPGACVIKGLGAIQMTGTEPVFEEGASSKTLLLRDTPEGWRFSVKYMPPIVRARNMKTT